ncbi:tetratricopeptide repeat protein [Actinomycetospora sp. CA-101289]|uniref:tetratricopeptide repeat protein n=1 Tax=Actinomycetospora sp. CA-101289 TaxID=3239893 RepID=UPI003D9775CA
MALRFGRVADVAGLDAELASAREAMATGKRSKARRAFRRVVTDAPAVPAPDPRAVAERHGAALIGLGDLDWAEGQQAEALASYREAVRYARVPPPVWRVLAEDAATRQDAGTQALDEVVGHLGVEHPAAWSPVVVRFAQQVCFPPDGVDADAHARAASLAGRIAGAAPRVEWAHRARGFALATLGRPAEAASALRESERLDPGHAVVPYWLGVLHHEAGDLDGAHDAFRRSLALDGAQPEVLRWAARTALARADRDGTGPGRAGTAVDEAVARLGEATRLQPARAELWFELGRALLRRDRPAARRPLSTAAHLAPGMRDHHLALADLAVDLGEPEEALAVLRNAQRHVPPDVEVRRRLGAVLLHLGRPAEAEAPLLAAAAAAPGDRELGRRLARCHLALDHPERAVALLEVVAERTPAEAELLARARAARGEAEAAVAELEAARRRAGGRLEPGPAFVLGCLRARARRWAGAVEAFDEARAGSGRTRPPADLDLHTAVACLRLGETDRARRLLETAPDDARRQYALGSLAAADDDWGAAGMAFSRALALDPAHREARVGLGVALEHAGRPGEAADAYESALREAPDDVWLRSRLAATCLLADRPVPDGRETDVVRLRALALARGGLFGKARHTWMSAVGTDDPGGIAAADARTAGNHQAWSALRDGDAAWALRLWEPIRVADPHDAWLAGAVAEAALRAIAAEARAGGAVEHLRERLEPALALAPDDSRLRYLAGLLALRDEDGRAAAILLRDVDDPYHRALAAAMAGDPGETPSSVGPARFALLRGTVLARAGRWSDALTAWAAGLAASGPGRWPWTLLLDGIARAAVGAAAPAWGAGVLAPFVTASPAAAQRAALLHLEAGDPDAARPVLDAETAPVPAEGERAGLRAALARGALRYAVDRLGVETLDGAVTALSRAAAVDPSTALGRRAASWAAEVRALPLGVDDDLTTALVHAEGRLRRDPTDLVAAHHVAVLSHRVLLASEPGAAAPSTVWPVPGLLVATWGAVLASPGFWASLATLTGREPDPEAREQVSDEFSDEVVRGLRDRAMRDGAGTAVPHLELDWGIELRVARAVADLPAARSSLRPTWFACGPRMLEMLEAAGTDGAALATDVRRTAERSDADLAALLSPWARARYLLDEGRPDDALEHLAGTDASPQRTRLRAEAWTATGVTRAETKDWAGSVKAFLAAGEAGADLAPHAEHARRAASKRAGEITRTDGRHARAVEVMERVRALLPTDAGYDADLAAVLSQHALELNNDQKDYEGAITVLRRAVALTPPDPTTTRYARVAIINLVQELVGDPGAIDRLEALVGEAVALEPDATARTEARRVAGTVVHNAAVEHAKAERYDAAVRLFGLSLRVEDDARTRSEAALAHARRAGVRLDRGDRAGARVDLRGAVALDPENTRYRTLLAQLD